MTAAIVLLLVGLAVLVMRAAAVDATRHTGGALGGLTMLAAVLLVCAAVAALLWLGVEPWAGSFMDSVNEP